MKRVEALAKGMRLLSFLTAAGSGTIREAATATGLPEPTAARLLETLHDEGFVQRIKARRRYWPTIKTLELGTALPPLPILVELAGRRLDALSDGLRMSTMLAGAIGRGMEVLRANSRRVGPAITRFVPGYGIPFDRGASGLTLLAFLPADLREALWRRANLSRTWEAGELKRLLTTIRRSGHYVTGEGFDGKELCIAVPVLIDELAVATIECRCIRAVTETRTIQERCVPLLKEHSAGLSTDHSLLRHRSNLPR